MMIALIFPCKMSHPIHKALNIYHNQTVENGNLIIELFSHFWEDCARYASLFGVSAVWSNSTPFASTIHAAISLEKELFCFFKKQFEMDSNLFRLACGAWKGFINTYFINRAPIAPSKFSTWSWRFIIWTILAFRTLRDVWIIKEMLGRKK